MPEDAARGPRERTYDVRAAYFGFAMGDRDLALQWLQHWHRLEQEFHPASPEDLAWAETKLAENAELLAELGPCDGAIPVDMCTAEYRQILSQAGVRV